MAVKKLYITGGSIIPQSDWLQNDETQADYIKNKPKTLELSNDPDSTTEGIIGQMCVNTETNIAFICTDISDDGTTFVWQKVPTKLSDLENDLDIITADVMLSIMNEAALATPIADIDNAVLMTEDNKILIL